jgi:hypothetical protein
MPGDPKQCALVPAATELAVEAKDSKLKKKFLELAKQWTTLANDLEMARELTERLPKKRKPRRANPHASRRCLQQILTQI